MGWTSIPNSRISRGHVETPSFRGTVTEFFQREFWPTGKCTILKGSVVGEAYYAAVRCADGSVFALVVLLEGPGICYKEMSEDMGPYYYDCPKSILALLTPTESKTAQEWRSKCGMAQLDLALA
jgi:hypothetical protein